MLGRNEFHFNHATMKEIVQHYLDTVLFVVPSPHVREIEYRGAPDRVFIIRTEETESKDTVTKVDI